MTLEEIGKYRATAQQKSMDAIRAAEERYNKAKKSDDKMVAEKTVGLSAEEEGEIKQVPETSEAGGVKLVSPPPKHSGNDGTTGILGTVKDSVIGFARSAKDLLTGR